MSSSSRLCILEKSLIKLIRVCFSQKKSLNISLKLGAKSNMVLQEAGYLVRIFDQFLPKRSEIVLIDK